MIIRRIFILFCSLLNIKFPMIFYILFMISRISSGGAHFIFKFDLLTGCSNSRDSAWSACLFILYFSRKAADNAGLLKYKSSPSNAKPIS